MEDSASALRLPPAGRNFLKSEEQQSSGVLLLWHRHRAILFLVLAAVSLLLLGWQRFRGPQKQFSSSPLPGATRIKSYSEDEDAISDPKEAQAEKQILTRPAPKRFTGSKLAKDREVFRSTACKIQPLVFFSSLTGSTKQRASDLVHNLHLFARGKEQILPPQEHDLSYIDYDDYFVTPSRSESSDGVVRYFYLLLLPTYNIDTVLNIFLSHLQETHHDFRVDTAPLSGLAGYSVFGFGDREEWKTEQEGFCSQALEVDRWMARLTSKKRGFPIGMGDVKSDVDARMNEWTEGICKSLLEIASGGGLGEGIPGSGDALESDEEGDSATELPDNAEPLVQRRKRRRTARVDDLEDIKGQVQTRRNVLLPIDFTTSQPAKTATLEPKEMVPKTSPTYAALTKQGYSIIGSHSGVKICRWTKSALRGRGSCYKYSFYGIKSHLCMETTPSLSCSNKCVFCWRHGTNPVGTTWRWKIDPPEMIFAGAKEGHLQKIKMMRGVPGVRAERFQEAMRIRHCALSLVGEPIFYPHINEFLRLLHGERISSFLVCNAQHPEQLAALEKVTQLYVSIDASNKESLRKVDRPLHRDFWERFLQCLDILKEKRFRMRTVFRLTLVKGFNVEDEAEGYAELVAKGLPCFVEVKGVTYCGTSASAGAGLTMQNVPFYEEVVAFVEALNGALERRNLDYGIAAEHAHSCCILVASKRFLIERKWHTLIDYDKFFACLESGEEFAPEDYVGAPTPEWATFGQGGFDPADARVYRKGKNKRLDVVRPEGD
ncbi:MAG: hypothetical protein L6R37_000372 [Teloschistes peruensis]|nr:MAG: hypothetical protein L6R37_000372 [Teloschistes peruensis]